MNFGEYPFRDCPKSTVGVRNEASRAIVAAPFVPFLAPYGGQIHPRRVALTPFRTVSLRSRVNKGNMSRAARSILSRSVARIYHYVRSALSHMAYVRPSKKPQTNGH